MSEQQVQRQNAPVPMLFVFLFSQIVHRTIRIRPNSLKPLFGTPLVLSFILTFHMHIHIIV